LQVEIRARERTFVLKLREEWAMPSPSNADQIAYWNGEVGEKWVKAQAGLDRMLAPVMAELLAASRIRPGERVLDVGCGCGATSLQMAATATVVGVDISAPMIAQAKRAAAAAGVRNAAFLIADAAEHRFKPEFDLLFSRFGVMFFADPAAAFANLRTALKPSGRAAFSCWRDWRENEWVREPVLAVLPHVPPPEPPAPDAPGPFSFADRSRVERILTEAGFSDIAIRPFDAKVTIADNIDDAVSHARDFGPASRLLAEATEEQNARATEALRALVTRLAAERKPITMDAAAWIVTATA
jgi:ubiquinone/menaquinone biosynthesis C-methylase UbiE